VHIPTLLLTSPGSYTLPLTTNNCCKAWEQGAVIQICWKPVRLWNDRFSLRIRFSSHFHRYSHQNIISEDNHFNRLGHKMESEEASILLLFGLELRERDTHIHIHRSNHWELINHRAIWQEEKNYCYKNCTDSCGTALIYVLLIETLKT
jgi:hypothetical protein